MLLSLPGALELWTGFSLFLLRPHALPAPAWCGCHLASALPPLGPPDSALQPHLVLLTYHGPFLFLFSKSFISFQWKVLWWQWLIILYKFHTNDFIIWSLHCVLTTKSLVSFHYHIHDPPIQFALSRPPTPLVTTIPLSKSVSFFLFCLVLLVHASLFLFYFPHEWNPTIGLLAVGTAQNALYLDLPSPLYLSSFRSVLGNPFSREPSLNP